MLLKEYTDTFLCLSIHALGSIMDDYLNTFREMISLCGFTDHTIKSYSYLYPCLSGLSYEYPPQDACGCFLGGTARFYPLAPKRLQKITVL